MTKSDVQRVVRETVKDHCKDESVTFTREMRWQVFLNCVDNLFADGKITKQQHHNWTNPF